MNGKQANDRAPAYAMRESYIDAPVQLVWSILADIQGWPQWNREVKEVSLHGEVSPGTGFHWTSGGMKIRSCIEEVESQRRIVWSGRTMGIRAIHSWMFTEEGSGTRVRTEESFEGLIVRFMAGKMRKTLEKALEQGLGALKDEAEGRCREARHK